MDSNHVKYLYVFDFDGTLFKSCEKVPDWWNGSVLDDKPFSYHISKYSLDEPCVPKTPDDSYWVQNVVKKAKKVWQYQNKLSVLLTGRLDAQRQRISELLQQKSIEFDDMLFNTGKNAVDFKVEVIERLLEQHPRISKVEIWENENVPVYRDVVMKHFESNNRELEITTHHVSVIQKKLNCKLSDLVGG
jgi:hypothetical protein